MEEYYIFRLSVDDMGFIDKMSKARIIYRMLRVRPDFPKFEDYQQPNNVFFHGKIDCIVDEFVNFTQFFPQYTFTLWLSYMCKTKLCVIRIKDREVLGKKMYNETNGLELIHNSKYFPDFNRKNLRIYNEITKYLI